MAEHGLRSYGRSGAAEPGDFEAILSLAKRQKRHAKPLDEYSTTLDTVLQASNGKMFPIVRKEFPEYVDALACRLADKAQEIIDNILDLDIQEPEYVNLAASLAPHDIQRAQQIADNLEEQIYRNLAYEKMAERLAPYDIAKAQELADTITNQAQRELAYQKMAISLAPHDLEKAKKLVVDTIPNQNQREKAYTEMAVSLAPHDLEKAKKLVVDTFTNQEQRELVYTDMAVSLAPHDPTKAEQLADTITNWKQRILTYQLIKNPDHDGLSPLEMCVRSARFDRINEYLWEPQSSHPYNYCKMIRGLSR